jgi:hypothetical protein
LKILVICSGIDFINYTRRASIEAIHRLNPDLEILMFNSVLNIWKKKNTAAHIKFHLYHFWVVEKLRKFRVFVYFEHFIRGLKWKKFFLRFEIIFLIDPNQYYLLPYLNGQHKLVYLLRDPSVLQDPVNIYRELPLIKRANVILGISKNLCTYYLEKYYGFIPANVHLWPNSVDLDLWNYGRWGSYLKAKSRPLAGLAGNINYVIDIKLLIHIAKRLPECDFEIAGKLDLNEKEKEEISKLLDLPNVNYLGFIPYDQFPSTVINWDIGLIAAKADHEYAKYLNNNKQYQYIALGKPFVTYRFDTDYNEFKDLVFIAMDQDDYIEKIKEAILKAKMGKNIEKGILIAKKNSSENRATQFLRIINSE